MENLQHAVFRIQQEKITSISKAKEIIEMDEAPSGMQGYCRCITTDDEEPVYIYPCGFGYIAYDTEIQKTIVVEGVLVGWTAIDYSKMYRMLKSIEDLEGRVHTFPMILIEMDDIASSR